ncbi:MAG: transketolase C-terminal domain-containing protein, partial [Woeseiaceae bacterium]
LAGSNNTIWSGSVDVNEGSEDGNYIYFGVREFGMTAISNGIGLHGGFIPYNATFLVFSDYARNAVRMSALLPAHNIYVYTHDSIGLGEDGPTHQPVEHVASLRLIPGLDVWRPCDTTETAMAWKCAIENTGRPSVLVLTRQGLPHQERSAGQVEDIARGGYVLAGGHAEPDALIIATGSEVSLAVEAATALSSEGVKVNVVSMPNPGLFLRQDAAWQESVLPAAVRARVVVEAGVTACWSGIAGDAGRVIGVDTFGASAPGPELYEHYGLTAKNVSQAVRESLAAVG